MKNQEIIAAAAVSAGVLTQQEADGLMSAGADIPFHTAQGWKMKGEYKVREGEQGTEVKIWKKKDGGGFYLAKAFLYSQNQVEITAQD